MSSSSSLTMCTSTDDCFCQEQVRQSLLPNSSKPQRRRSSADIASKSSSGSGGAVATEQHLLERVSAQPQAERLQRDHLVGRDVAEIHLRAEMLDEPGLRRLRRRLPEEVVEVDRVRDLVDEAGAHLARGAEDAGGAALAGLGDHLPGAGVTLFLDPFDPLVRREDDFGVLGADLGEHGEVAREVLDQLELALAGDLDRAVRDLDVRDAELAEPALVVVELILDIDDLEEGAADDDRLLAQDVELALETFGDEGGAPAQLDDVDVGAARLEHVLPGPGAKPLVEHVGEAAVAVETEVKAGHRAPSASPGRRTAHRGRASCRARRCRRSAARSP